MAIRVEHVYRNPQILTTFLCLQKPPCITKSRLTVRDYPMIDGTGQTAKKCTALYVQMYRRDNATYLTPHYLTAC